jgi:Lon protease-like protein
MKQLRWPLLFASLLFANATAAAQPAGLPPVIPIFPLEVTMLFPGVPRPLHIFEPRYRAMVADALKGDRIIGMVTLKPGFEADYIVVRGLMKFRVSGEDATRPYRLAGVTAIPETPDEAERASLHKQRQRLETLITRGSDTKVTPDTTDEELVNTLAQYLPMTYAQRQALLELESVLARALALIDLIESKPLQVVYGADRSRSEKN